MTFTVSDQLRSGESHKTYPKVRALWILDSRNFDPESLFQERHWC